MCPSAWDHSENDKICNISLRQLTLSVMPTLPRHFATERLFT